MKIYINENEYVTASELKRVTRKQLENNITGKTFGGANISNVYGHNYIWNYRKQDGIFKHVCAKDEATMITIEHGIYHGYVKVISI